MTKALCVGGFLGNKSEIDMYFTRYTQLAASLLTVSHTHTQVTRPLKLRGFPAKTTSSQPLEVTLVPP